MAEGHGESEGRLEMPEFQSKVPEYLLTQATPVERHLLPALSRLEQQNEWMGARLAEMSIMRHEIAALEARLEPIERWREALGSKWAVLVAVGVAIPAVLEVLGLVQKLMK